MSDLSTELEHMIRRVVREEIAALGAAPASELLRIGEALAAQAQDAVLLPSPEVARQIRERAHVSQAALARDLGVHRVTLLHWETGARTPRGQIRAWYAHLLHEMQSALETPAA